MEGRDQAMFLGERNSCLLSEAQARHHATAYSSAGVTEKRLKESEKRNRERDKKTIQILKFKMQGDVHVDIVPDHFKSAAC